MFKYSIDEYIASEQKNSGEKLLEGISAKCTIQICPELDEAITSYKMSSFGFLSEVHAVAEKCGEPLVFVAMGQARKFLERYHSLHRILFS